MSEKRELEPRLESGIGKRKGGCTEAGEKRNKKR
jgi:hypothetical protein